MKMIVNESVYFDYNQEEDSYFLIDINTGEILCFNKMASFIWDEILSGVEVEKIVNQIVDEFESIKTKADIEKDFQHFLSTLVNEKIVTVVA